MIVYTDKTFRLKEEIKRTIFSIVGKIVCRGRGQVRVGRIKVYKIIKKRYKPAHRHSHKGRVYIAQTNRHNGRGATNA